MLCVVVRKRRIELLAKVERLADSLGLSGQDSASEEKSHLLWKVCAVPVCYFKNFLNWVST